MGGGHLAGFGGVAALLTPPARNAPPCAVVLLMLPAFVHTRWTDLGVVRAAALLPTLPLGRGVRAGVGRGIDAIVVGRGASEPTLRLPELARPLPELLLAAPLPPLSEPLASVLTQTRLPPAFGTRGDAGIALPPRAVVTVFEVMGAPGG